MIRDKKAILIRNVFCMLSYAFQSLRHESYARVAREDFDGIEDLLAAILAAGTALQLKRGLHREYVTHAESLPVLRGKLNMPGTIRNRIQAIRKLACEYDELTADNLFNQILKTTLLCLLRTGEVSLRRKTEIKRVLVYFSEISTVDLKTIRWERLQYSRENGSYEMLMNICRLALDGMLPNTEAGPYKLEIFKDAQMAGLYERFIREYYRQEHLGSGRGAEDPLRLDAAGGKEVAWDLTEEPAEEMRALLPKMQTDVTLRRGNKVLIIDAKYYGRTLQENFDRQTLHSGNLYQIFSYVKNEAARCSDEVSGLLLYAKTEEAVTPDVKYKIGGNWIAAKTLDLSVEFDEIRKQLDELIQEYLI